ncbi:MAG: hypothetical protein QME41_00980 [Actinomycetota bacterium]|nr:hypothetical protein [Actinomycetota bacterium]
MSSSEGFGVGDTDLAKAKRYIRSTGKVSIARSYFKETHCSVENAEIDSEGLYCFEKLIRMAFIAIMGEDAVLGRQDGFIEYIKGLSDSFESPIINDWSPEQSSRRAGDFMVSFYNIYSYQWKRHGRPIDKTLTSFLTIMRECLDYSYTRLSEKLDSLPVSIRNNIDKAFFLTNGIIDSWYDEKAGELEAA